MYYVQYAHARICTLLKNLEAEGYTVPAADAVDFSLLTDETEQALIKQIASYGQVVLLAARDYDPSHINRSGGTPDQIIEKTPEEKKEILILISI